jgi:hypothetical protein
LPKSLSRDRSGDLRWPDIDFVLPVKKGPKFEKYEGLTIVTEVERVNLISFFQTSS